MHRLHTYFCHIHLQEFSLTLISGRSGAILGHPVLFNLTGQGKLIGPLLHETQDGAYYILFGLGKEIRYKYKSLKHHSKKVSQSPCVFRQLAYVWMQHNMVTGSVHLHDIYKTLCECLFHQVMWRPSLCVTSIIEPWAKCPQVGLLERRIERGRYSRKPTPPSYMFTGTPP